MTAPRRVWRWLAARPFRSSLAVMMIVAIPGYYRLEKIQSDQEAERQQRLETQCIRSVEVRDDNRKMWLFVLNLLAGGELVPTVADALDELLPELECNSDNVAVPAG